MDIKKGFSLVPQLKYIVLSLLFFGLPAHAHPHSHEASKQSLDNEVKMLRREVADLKKVVLHSKHEKHGSTFREKSPRYTDRHRLHPGHEEGPVHAFKTSKYTPPPATPDSVAAPLNFPTNLAKHPQFYQIVAQNGPYSTAHVNHCINDMFCFSGLFNVDLRYYNRKGIFPPKGTGSLMGVGVLPLFGPYKTNMTGNLNNANLFLDVAINHWMMAHFGFAFVNSSIKVRAYAHDAPDWRSTYDFAASLKVDEAYLVFANPDRTPFFVKFGRMYLDFGDYKMFPMTESLAQLIEQIRAGAVVFGATSPDGFYATAEWSISQQSSGGLNLIGVLPLARNSDRNYGFKIGYLGDIKDVHVSLNGSYIADIRDSDYLSGSADLVNRNFSLDNADFVDFFAGQVVEMDRADAVAFHGDAHWGPYGIVANYVTALKSLTVGKNSRIYAWDISFLVDFPFFYHQLPSQLELGFQKGGASDVFNLVITTDLTQDPPPPILLDAGNILPDYRLIGSYTVNILPYVALGFQWVHDQDWPPKKKGTGLSSDIGLIRISVEF